MKKKLFIFSNESISIEENKYYCDNLDLKSTPEGLNKKFEVNLLGKKSVKKRSHEIKIKRIKVFNNFYLSIYFFNFYILKNFRTKTYSLFEK